MFQRAPIRKGRVSGESEKVFPGRLGRRPLPVPLMCLCNTQWGATPEARRGARAAAGLARPGTSGNPGLLAGRATPHTTRAKQRRERPCADFFRIFPFSWEGYGNPLLLFPGRGAFSSVLPERAGHRRLRPTIGQTADRWRPQATPRAVLPARHRLVLLDLEIGRAS